MPEHWNGLFPPILGLQNGTWEVRRPWILVSPLRGPRRRFDILAELFSVSQAHRRVTSIPFVLLEGIGIERLWKQACNLVSIARIVTGVSFYAKNGSWIPFINHDVRIPYLHAATYVENGEFTLGAELMSPSPPKYSGVDSPRFFSRSSEPAAKLAIQCV